MSPAFPLGKVEPAQPPMARSANPHPLSHTRVQVDKVALQRGAIYHGGLLLATSGGAATVAVYDGLSTSGELIDYFTAAVSDYEKSIFERGIAIREGLYVDIGSNVSSFVVYYEPVRKSSGEE